MSIDYSQVELRVLTSMSKDENLIKAYREEKDLHDLTARRIFNLSDSDDVTREQRTIAKIINFSIIYGKTAFGLAKELKIPVKDASEYIKKYFEQYPRVTTFEIEVIEFGEEHGYVKTLVVSWNDAADKKLSVARDAFVIPSRTLSNVAGIKSSSNICLLIASTSLKGTKLPSNKLVSPEVSILTFESICLIIISICLSSMSTPWLR